MSTRHSPAFQQAIDAFRAPGQYLRLKDVELPEDMLLILRIAAGDTQAIDQASAVSNEPASAVREAAVMFIQHLMFYPGSNSFRVLGVDPSASDSQIKEHYRWLVRWLHPDRNSDEWDAVYAERVTLAWQDLRTPERRRAYEGARGEEVHADAWAPQVPTPVTPARRLRPVEPEPDDFVLSARTVRRLPALILAVVTVCVATVLGLQYYPVQDVSTTRAEASAPDPALAVDVAAVQAGKRDVDYVVAAGVPARERAPETDLEPAPVALAEPEPVAVSVAGPVAPAVAPPVAMPVAMPAATTKLASPPTTPIALAQAKAAPQAVERIAAPPARPTPPAVPAARPQAVLLSRNSPPTPAVDANPAQKQSITQVDPAQAVQTAPADAGMDEAAARDVILRFRSAYASGNLNQVRSLLARNSAELDNEQAATLKTYRKLFESSVSRHMEISNPSWLANRDTAILVASFEAWIQPVGKADERRVHGDIRFDLRREDGEMRIIRVRHVAKGG